MHRTKLISLSLTLLTLAGNGALTASAVQQEDEAASLRAAAWQGRVNDVRTLLDQGLHVNAADTLGQTPLMYAASGGHSQVANLLLERGADVHAKEQGGWTPLMFAAQGGHTDLAYLLLGHGADLNASSRLAETPLMIAAFHGHTEVVSLLLERGADVNAMNEEGFTALTLAVGRGHDEVASLLREHVALTAGLVQQGDEAPLLQPAGGRYRVLVVPFESRALDRRFGEKVAKEIRERLEDFPTHAPVEERDFKRALAQYDLESDELNADRARQLANLMGVQVVYFATLEAVGSAFEVRGAFIDVRTGDEVPVPPVSVTGRSNESVDRVADVSFEAFEEQVRFVRAQQFCAEYVEEQQLDAALRNCNEALEINPNSVHVLFNKGMAYRIMFERGGTRVSRWADSSIAYFERVLEHQPGHLAALQNAAFMCSQSGDDDRASELYQRYLEYDPGNVPVRLMVAYDLANEGRMPEAIATIQAGLEIDERDLDLLRSLGDYSLRHSWTNPTYADIALEAYEQVLQIKGDEADLSIVENTLAAYTQANRTAEAIEFAESVLRSHSESARLWSFYADALGRADRCADASAAMDKVVEIDPAYPGALLRRGRFRLQEGHEQTALADFKQAVEIKGQEADSSIIISAVAAYTEAVGAPDGIEFAEFVLQRYSESARLWSFYADALGGAELYADAIAAIDRLMEIDPSYPNAYLKRGQFKLQGGDQEAASADFNLAIESGTSTPDEVFDLLWREAHDARSAGDLTAAIGQFENADLFVPAAQREELEFWWGYTEYQLGEQLARPESATPTELYEARERFEVAQSHLEQVGYAHEEAPVLRRATQQWLQNVEARIRVAALLLRAASEGRIDDVRTLLDRGASVNAKDDDGWTPLMYAAQEGHTEVVRLLVERGADVNAQDTEEGVTALMSAAQNGHGEVVNLLLEHGADLNAKAESGATALTLAAAGGHSEVVNVLLGLGGESRPELARQQALDEIVAWVCGKAGEEQCPDSTPTALIDFVGIRAEGGDVRHIYIFGNHYATYYWSDEGWALTPTDNLKQLQAPGAMTTIVAISMVAHALETYFAHNLTYTTEIAQLDFRPPNGVSIEIPYASATGWITKAQKDATECAIFYGSVPAEARSLIEGTELIEGVIGCK